MPSNKSAKTITIITVVFNGAKTLRATIDSIVPQLGHEVEYIIIDGGSTDGTQDIIQAYANHLAYWVSEPDEGIYDAWNKGLSCAAGQYIGFVGADDILLPDALNVYLDHIRKQPEIEYWSSRVALGHLGGRVIGQAWRWSSFRRYMTVAHVASFHRRDLYAKLGSYDVSFKIAGDYEFLLRAGENLKAGFIDRVIGVMGDGGISNSQALLAVREAEKAKILTNATSWVFARFDYFVALAKCLTRDPFRRV